MKTENYKLDKTTFSSLTFEEADNQMKKSAESLEERINHFNYLMGIAFRFGNNPWPAMDRTHFELRKRK